MKTFHSVGSPEVASILISGGIGIIKTDTLYGVVAKAADELAVKRVYDVKNRSDDKSPIILISTLEQLFDQPNELQKDVLRNVWPGRVSVIISSTSAPQWIKRDNHSVAYRLPDDDALIALLKQTGPLIAPSANPEGQAPAHTVNDAIRYFGDTVDFYVDGGTSTVGASQLLKMDESGATERLR